MLPDLVTPGPRFRAGDSGPEIPGRRFRAGADAGNVDGHKRHWVREDVRSLGGVGGERVIVTATATATATLVMEGLCTLMALTAKAVQSKL
jgi:hypothetical protein